MQSMDSQRNGCLDVTGLHPGLHEIRQVFMLERSLCCRSEQKSQQRWRNLWDFVVFEILFKIGFVCKVCEPLQCGGVRWISSQFVYVSWHVRKNRPANARNFEPRVGVRAPKNILKRKFDFCNILYFADNGRGMNRHGSSLISCCVRYFLVIIDKTCKRTQKTSFRTLWNNNNFAKRFGGAQKLI